MQKIMGRFSFILALVLTLASAWASGQSLRSDQARSHLYRTIILMQNEFERSSEMMQAKFDARRLWQEYEQLRRELVEPITMTPAYQQLFIDVQNAQQKLSRARRMGQLDAVFVYSHDLLTMRSEMRRLEDQALLGRQELESARQSAADATARITALRRDFEESIRFSPQFLSAKAQLERSQGGLASAFQ
jgi:hypothetical protein